MSRRLHRMVLGSSSGIGCSASRQAIEGVRVVRRSDCSGVSSLLWPDEFSAPKVRQL